MPCHVLITVRIFDKLKRIATDRDALGESPYRDIAGYGILGATLVERKRKASPAAERGTAGSFVSAPLEEKYWKKVRKTEGGCWLWTGERTRQGYGSLTVLTEGRKQGFRVHRLSWQFAFGHIPHGQTVWQTCGEKLCVNPAHLKIGDWVQNAVHRAAAAIPMVIRNARDQRPPRAKLSAAQVEDIRARYVPRKVSYTKLAAEFDVSAHTIEAIIRGVIWNNPKAEKAGECTSVRESDAGTSPKARTASAPSSAANRPISASSRRNAAASRQAKSAAPPADGTQANEGRS